jgi:cytochrome c oxidase cbb3-type subunit IV
MLKFIKQHMSTIAGIEIYPLVSFVIFFLFFLAVALWVWKGDKKHFNEMGNIPLEDR